MEAQFALMNLLSSHRCGAHAACAGVRRATRRAAQIEEAKRRFKLAVFLQMTHPGSPAIYYGDEVGVTAATIPITAAPIRGLTWAASRMNRCAPTSSK